MPEPVWTIPQILNGEHLGKVKRSRRHEFSNSGGEIHRDLFCVPQQPVLSLTGQGWDKQVPCAIQRVLWKPANNQGASINVTRSFNNRLGLRVREDDVKEFLGSLKHHCRSSWVVFTDNNKEDVDSHLGKHRPPVRVLKLAGDSFGHDHCIINKEENTLPRHRLY